MAEYPDIAEFLTVQYDREQKSAEDACYYFTDGTWTASRGEGHFLHPDGPHIEVADAEPWRKSVNLGVWNCDDPEDDCESIRAQWMAQAEFIAAHDPAHVLADIAAKRAIIHLYREERGLLAAQGHNAEGESRLWLLETVLQRLAAPYCEHPDFNPAWRIGA